MAIVGNLGIKSPASRETTYRIRLRRYVSEVFTLLNLDINAPTIDLENEMIAASAVIITSIDDYNRREIGIAYRRFFNDNEGPVRIARALGAGVDDALDVARVANIDLIRDISAQQRERLFREIADTTSDIPLTDRVQGVLSSSRNRARVIARDQTSKINGNLSRLRHQAAGATRYRWRTVGDERVRDDHAAVDGDIYDYGAPTGTDSGAMPTEDVQCRCSDDPIFE